MKKTKMELRHQQAQLKQFQNYLPTLQLKKGMLQKEVEDESLRLQIEYQELDRKIKEVEAFSHLLVRGEAHPLWDATKVKEVVLTTENVAGLDLPIFQEVCFADKEYFFWGTPLWIDSAVKVIKELVSQREKVAIYEKRCVLLQEELRIVSIRVNLFEKYLIPKAKENIKTIRIYLEDQMLSGFAQAKIAKKKIEERAYLV